MMKFVKSPGRTTTVQLQRWLQCVCFCLCAFSASLLWGQDPIGPTGASGTTNLQFNTLDIWNTYRPRLGVVYRTGDGVGYRGSYVSLQGFVPFGEPLPDTLTFADLRGLFGHDGPQGANFGIGKRVYLPSCDATVGLFCYYDYRGTTVNRFQSLSPGFDVLLNDWELRSNVYLPSIFDDQRPAPNQFRTNFLYINRSELALDGADVEVGYRLPVLGQFQPKLYAGAYGFDHPDRGRFFGFSTRLQAYVSDSVSLGVSVQNDEVYDTTANFIIDVRVPAGGLLQQNPLRAIRDSLGAAPLRRTAVERLAEPVYRQQNVALDVRETLARDPMTGDPIDFLHVAAGGNSDGSFESPYALLTDALADSDYMSGDIDVIYVHSGPQQSVTHTGDVMMVEGTQLLSNGPVQMVATQLGPAVLPFSGIDPDLQELPIIDSSVQLASHTTLSGFVVLSSNALGAIHGDNVVAVNILNNGFLDDGQLGGSGIFLQNIDVTNSADRITIADNFTDGELKQLAGVNITNSTRFEGDIVGNLLDENSDSGIFISGVGEFVGNVKENILDQNGFSGLALLNSNFTGDITDNEIASNVNTGLEIIGSDNTFTGNITENTISGINASMPKPNTSASRVFTVDNKRHVAKLADQTNVGMANSYGINMRGQTFTGTIADNELNNHVGGGLYIQDSKVFGDITGNEANDNFADGISIINSTFVGKISDNDANRNLLGGILVDVTDVFAGEIINNTANLNVSQGILIKGQPGADAEGDISGNTANMNMGGGIIVNTTTFGGSLMNNVANQNGFDGMLINSQTVSGDVSFNMAAQNTLSGLVIGSYGSTFDGNISNNTLNNNTGSGLDIASATFDGSINDNVANSNGKTGFEIRTTQMLMGDISGNTANMNRAGMIVGSPEFDGNVSGNMVSGNMADGLLFDVTKNFNGSVLSNTAESNGATGIRLALEGETFGDISFNTASMNNVGIQITAKAFNGVIEGNTANNNTREGIDITVIDDSPAQAETGPNNSLATAQNIDGGSFVLGANLNITDSTTIPHLTIEGTGDGTFDYYSFTAHAGDRGIFDIDFQNFDTELFLFDDAGNLLAENDDADNPFDDGDGIPDFVDSFIDFTFPNTTSHLFVIGVGKFDSFESAGAIMGEAPAMGDVYTLQVSIENHTESPFVGSELGVLDVLRNNLQGNNGGTGRELVINNRGTGTMCLLLDGNKSLNTVAPGQFNFDLLNTGGGNFDLFEFGTSVNTGTVGSSDGSVTIP